MDTDSSDRRLMDVGEYKLRKLQLEGNKIVTRPLARLDDDVIPRKSKSAQGRKRKYTPTTLKNKINKYFEWVEQNDEVPSIKGLMIFCKMYKDAFYKYIKEPEFVDILEHAKMIIAEWAETDVYTTKGIAAGKIAYMKNIHSWSDKLETNNVTEQRIISIDEAKAKIEMLAPKLLELLKNQTVLNQIGTSQVLEGEVADA